ncbi:hypothetical protein MKW98_018932 [Papaver atlanticum]|uniref:TraB family protein n=1 Tax=Papaver atlanticum TaxID=357466 RepID=A0AAD4TJG4_9MAGN|nr:hypothetical protein MKW98_018932 [Papaver atlanticum]
MSAAILSRIIKISTLTTQRLVTSSSSLLITPHYTILDHHHDVKWYHNHYQHDLPGIPNDGKVVLLNNSMTGSQVYLVGTIHVSKESSDTVKKVINYVMPDVVAVELCNKRAMELMKWKPGDDDLYKLCLKSMKAPGGLSMKLFSFLINLWYRRLRAGGTFPGLEFKVAMEESIRVKAECFPIDQDVRVLFQQLSKLLSYDFLRKIFTKEESKEMDQVLNYFTDFKDENLTRSSVREMIRFLKTVFPEISRLIVEDRDKVMFTRLRRFRGKVVAVVGMGHMDGIELMWKSAENDDNTKPTATSEDVT